MFASVIRSIRVKERWNVYRQLWIARMSQMWIAWTDCTGSQHFAQPTVLPVMQPRGAAQAGPTLFTHWATWVWLCQ
jgi:hypothetical protein